MFAGALRAEWIKLTTIRSHFVLAIVAVAFSFLVVLLTANAASGFDFATGEDLADLVVGVGLVTIMLLAVVSVLATTGEFTYNTLRPTFAAIPNRWSALAAKLVINVVTNMVLTAITVIVGWVGASAILDRSTITLSDGGARGQLMALVLLSGLLSMLGMALAMLMRNSAAAIAILLLWPFVVESLLAGFFSVLGQEGLVKFLPYIAGFRMVNLFDEGSDTSDLLSPTVGGIYFACVVIGLWLLGALSTDRRDA
jgi:ABC-2 type transport system permease protein